MTDSWAATSSSAAVSSGKTRGADSAVAAGATFESSSVADIVDDLVDSGVFGSADSGFDTTLFKVPNVSETEKAAASEHLSYDSYAKMIIYAPN